MWRELETEKSERVVKLELTKHLHSVTIFNLLYKVIITKSFDRPFVSLFSCRHW
jgi:hypothetical protein